MILRYVDQEKQNEKHGRCFHLNVAELDSRERKVFEEIRGRDDIPTHKVTFYDFECYHVVEGKIKEDTEDRLVLEMGRGKEYEFLPFVLSQESGG